MFAGRAQLVFVLLAFAIACESNHVPDLLELRSVSAHSVGLGDEIELRGDGFPEGRPANVTFLGDLHRPGQPVLAGVEIATNGASRSREIIATRIDKEALRRFCGSHRAADHTTFHGDIRVSFTSRSPSAPPVYGTLSGVTLDFVTTADASLVEARSAEGKRLVRHLGLEVEPSRHPLGLSVSHIVRGGVGQQAGLIPSDVLVELDGVTLQALADLRPSPEKNLATVKVLRAGRPTPFETTFDVSAMRTLAASNLLPAFVIVSLVAGLVIFFTGPLRRSIDWLEHLARERARRQMLKQVDSRKPWRELVVSRGRPMLSAQALTSYVVFLGVSTAFTVLGCGSTLVAEEQDLSLLIMLGLVASLLSRFVSGGTSAGRFSLWCAIRAAGGGLAWSLPAIFAVVAVVVAFESVSLSHIVEEQGGVPWRWAGFQNPGLFCLLLLLLATAVPKSTGPEQWPELAPLGNSRPRRASRVALVGEWTTLWVVAGLAACLFLGGWRIPVSLSSAFPAELSRALGAAALHAKLWLAALVVVGMRAAVRRVPVNALRGLYWTALLPWSFAAAALSVFWAEGADRYELPAAALGVALVLLSALVATYVLRRLSHAASLGAAHSAINPWL